MDGCARTAKLERDIFVTHASLPAATEYQAIEKSIALPVAKPLIVVIKIYQISPSISLDSAVRLPAHRP